MKNLLLFALWLSLCAVESWAYDPPQSVDPPKIPRFRIPFTPPTKTIETDDTVERLAAGILRMRIPHWHICGEKLSEVRRTAEADTLARVTVRAAKAHALNPWGLAGVIENESGWDRCALGVTPRQWAQKIGKLRSKRATISYSADTVLALVRSPESRKRWRGRVDLGLCQLLAKYYPGDPVDLLTVDPGVDICAAEMAARAAKHETKAPWLYWPGKRSTKYAKRVKMWARKLGARKDEI